MTESNNSHDQETPRSKKPQEPLVEGIVEEAVASPDPPASFPVSYGEFCSSEKLTRAQANVLKAVFIQDPDKDISKKRSPEEWRAIFHREYHRPVRTGR